MRSMSRYIGAAMVLSAGLLFACSSRSSEQTIATVQQAQNGYSTEEVDHNRPSYFTRCVAKNGDPICVNFSFALRAGGDSYASIDEMVNGISHCTPRYCHERGGRFAVFVGFLYKPALDEHLASSHNGQAFGEFKEKMKNVHAHLLSNKALTREDVEYSIQQQKESFNRVQEALGSDKIETEMHLRGIQKRILATLFASKIDAPKKELTDEQQTLSDLNKVVDGLATQIAPFEVSFRNEVTRFRAYRETEVARLTKLQEISRVASQSEEFEVLFRLSDEIRKVLKAERSESQALVASNVEAKRAFIAKQAELQTGLEPYRQILEKKSMQLPSLFTRELASLDSMGLYAEERTRKMEASGKQLQDGIRKREQMLIVKKAEAETRQALADATTLRLSAEFLRVSRQKIEELWKKLPKSPVTQLDYQSEQYDRMLEFLQYEPLCEKVSAGASWMTEGCQFIKLQFPKIRQYKDVSLPFVLKMGVTITRRKQLGVDEALLTSIEQLVKDKKLGDAVRQLDAVLRMVDQGAP